MTNIYADNWQAYWDKGFRGVLPLPPMQKTYPPKGYTGYAGSWPSWPDCHTWAEDYPNGNICLRLPENIIGIDVDAYGEKSGGATLAHAEQQWGALPPTVRSTSREDNVSGIRLYKVPPGTEFESVISFPEKGFGNIEICQFAHRYVVVSPSLHDGPEHRQYRWLDHDGFYTDIPNVDELPDLPNRWIMALRRVSDSVTEQADVRTVLAALPEGLPDDVVTARLNQAIQDIAGGVGSRHDVTLGHVLALLRLGEQGHSGVPAALMALRNVFGQAITPDRGSATAYAEFDRMMYGQRGHDLIASNPSLDPSAEEAELVELGGISEDRLPPTPEVLEDFWTARHSLKTIRQFAYARMCSPWAVLGAVLCRVLATVPPHVTLPPVIGGRGSLNLFVALVGPPGSGKDTSHDAAVEVFPGPTGLEQEIYTTSAGSAEGIAHQYMHRDKKDLVQDRTSVMFFIPEIDTLVGLSSRAGSTLMPTLRSAYTGSDIGFAWADSTKRLPMPKHSYRLTMLLGVQPEHAAPLLADASGGFPQRCLWLPTVDQGISIHPPEAPFPLESMPGRTWSGSIRDQTIQIPDEVAHLIRVAHVQRSNGEGGALDGHALFTREKVAVALATLDHRNNMSMGDWELAGVIMRKSDQTRTEIEAVIHEATQQANSLLGMAAGHRQLVTDEIVGDGAARRVGRRVVNLLRAKGPMTQGALRKLINSRDRDYLPEALELQAEAGTVELVEGQWQAQVWEE